jgi:hypothetical protein
MNSEVRTELIRCSDGTRLLRFNEVESGLSMEKRLDPELPVVQQKERWLSAFRALLERELSSSPS